MSLRTLGRASVVYREVRDDKGYYTTRAFWQWDGRLIRKSADTCAYLCIGDGQYINQQTGSVSCEEENVEHLYSAESSGV